MSLFWSRNGHKSNTKEQPIPLWYSSTITNNCLPETEKSISVQRKQYYQIGRGRKIAMEKERPDTGQVIRLSIKGFRKDRPCKQRKKPGYSPLFSFRK